MTDLPTSVDVGPFTYTIHADEARMNKANRDDGSDAWGCCNHAKLEIIIDPNQAPAMIQDTLLHETLHALTAMVGLTDELSARREEAIVRRLTPALLHMLRTNPALVGYLVA